MVIGYDKRNMLSKGWAIISMDGPLCCIQVAFCCEAEEAIL